MSRESATKFPQISDARRTTKVAAQRISRAPLNFHVSRRKTCEGKAGPQKEPGLHKSTAEEDVTKHAAYGLILSSFAI